MKMTNQLSDISGQWCLVAVRQKKRKSFLIHLNNDLNKKQLQQLILEVIEPQDSVYEDMVLIRISNFSEAKTHLQQIEYFHNIQRLKPNDVNRMLNR